MMEREKTIPKLKQLAWVDPGGSVASGSTAEPARRADGAAPGRCLACHGPAGDRRLLFEIVSGGLGMNIASDDLATLRETTTRSLLVVLWLHVPICLVIGIMRGTDLLIPTAFMAA